MTTANRGMLGAFLLTVAILACLGVARMAMREPVPQGRHALHLEQGDFDRRETDEFESAVSSRALEVIGGARRTNGSKSPRRKEKADGPPAANKGQIGVSADVPVPRHLEAIGSPAEWEKEFANVEWRELLGISGKIMAYIKEEGSEELTQRLDNGVYKVVSTTGSIDGLHSGADRLITGLDLVRFKFGGEVQRYQLPRERYPDLYALADKAQWLEQRAYRMRYLP